MTRFSILLLTVFLAISPYSAIAKGGGGGSVHVNSYTRSDGTQVRAYDRSGPSGSSGTAGGSGGHNIGEAQPANVDADGWSRDIDVSAATYPHLHRAEPTAKSSYRNDAYRTPGRIEVDGHGWIERSDRQISSSHSYRGSYTHRTSSRREAHNSYSYPIRRDSHGKIIRSQEAKNDFKRAHPCPSTGKSSGACPGYVIDHIQALKHGGADAPSNMQWQTVEEAKAKDKWE